MSVHLEHVLDKMREEIVRAEIRDSHRIRAHKLALAVALIAPQVLADPELPDEHKQKVRELLAECRALAVGSRANEQPETLLDGIPIDNVLADIRLEVEREISALNGAPDA